MASLALAINSLVARGSWSGRISGNIICLRPTRFPAEAQQLLDPP